jgi:hypothetical protein
MEEHHVFEKEGRTTLLSSHFFAHLPNPNKIGRAIIFLDQALFPRFAGEWVHPGPLDLVLVFVFCSDFDHFPQPMTIEFLAPS